MKISIQWRCVLRRQALGLRLVPEAPDSDHFDSVAHRSTAARILRYSLQEDDFRLCLPLTGGLENGVTPICQELRCRPHRILSVLSVSAHEWGDSATPGAFC